MSERFSLKWNDFQSNVSRTFSQLRSEEEFFDVSLVSDDQKMMSAHKLVLSASSPYFKHILTTNKHSHPLLCLDGVSSTELQCVLDYIYQGEVQIHHDQLDRFLQVAQKLKLEGLIPILQKQDQESADPDTISLVETVLEVKQHEEEVEHEAKKEVKQLEAVEQAQHEHEEVKKLKRRRSTATLSFFARAEDFANVEEINQHFSQYVLKGEDGIFSCGFCGKSGVKTKQNLISHLETHIEGLPYQCPTCGKAFKNRSTLGSHKAIHRV